MGCDLGKVGHAALSSTQLSLLRVGEGDPELTWQLFSIASLEKCQVYMTYNAPALLSISRLGCILTSEQARGTENLGTAS